MWICQSVGRAWNKPETVALRKESFQIMDTDFVGLRNTALYSIKKLCWQILLDIVIIRCCLQVGQEEDVVCSLAGQVSSGRFSENRQLLLHFLLYGSWRKHEGIPFEAFNIVLRQWKRMKGWLNLSWELKAQPPQTWNKSLILSGRRGARPGLAESQVGLNMNGKEHVA